MAWTKTRAPGQNSAPPPLLPNELARLNNGQVEIRPQAMRLHWPMADLVTADGHKLRGAFMCGVRAINEPAERKVLTEAFLSRKPSVTIDDICAYLAPSLQAAAANTAAQKNVADWLEESAKPLMAEALRKAAEKVAFNCGLEVLAPFQVDIESPSFQQQKLEQLERNLSEQRVAGQVEHFEKAAGLLKQFDALRQAAPGLTPGAVLQQMSPSDQGTMLQTLLLAAGKGKQVESLWGVAGPYLLKIDPRVSPPKTELITLPADLGPLRSVEPADIDGQRVLLVGARNGVMVVRPEDAAHPELYRDPDIASQMGFRRSLIRRHELWACHGDGGIIGWELGATDHPKFVFRPTHLAPAPAAPNPSASVETPRHGSPRNLTRLDDSRLMFSMGEKLFTIDAGGQVTALAVDDRSEVVAILQDAHSIYIVRENGGIFARDPATLAVTSEEHRGGRINGAASLPWLGSARLLLVTDEGPIYCLGTDDQLVTQYLSPHRGLLVVSATADLVAAVSADRQRVVLWNSWDGRRPIGDFSVASVAKHRLGDIHFA